MLDLTFDVGDLALDEITVSTMRDAAALPQADVPIDSSCSCVSCSCCCCQPEQR
jgi:hypothetical protein